MKVQVISSDGTAYDYNVSGVNWPNDSDPGQKVTMSLLGGGYVVINWAYVSEIHVEES